MYSLLQRGIGHWNDSKDNNHFICNLFLYKEYVAHTIASTSTYLSWVHINTVKEGGRGEPWGGGATALLASPIPMPLVSLWWNLSSSHRLPSNSSSFKRKYTFRGHAIWMTYTDDDVWTVCITVCKFIVSNVRDSIGPAVFLTGSYIESSFIWLHAGCHTEIISLLLHCK